ncbi:uncharacterized protein [Hyperolius riggenbachi]|uniref:uncharacterized protein isoform X2 n=1 Tax=Hyperolius riggenbachi TaxID=752182 RepID=UPI0035A3217C
MVNAFLKYGITIAILITFLTKISQSCEYNKTALQIKYTHVLINLVTDVTQHLELYLKNNSSDCCKTINNQTEMFPDLCNNLTLENKTRRHLSRENCYNDSKNKEVSCQLKNLVYLDCLLSLHLRNLKRPDKDDLKEKLTVLVNVSNSNLCGNLTRKNNRNRRRRRDERRPEKVKKCQHGLCKLWDTLIRYPMYWQQYLL